MYWGLRLIDTGLVIPPDLPLPPLGADLCFHLVPAVVLTIDAILLSPPWPSSPMNPQAPLLTLGVSTGVAFAYWWWIVSVLLRVSRFGGTDGVPGNLLLAQWLLSLPHFRVAVYISTHRIVHCQWSDDVGCRWCLAGVVCVCQWLRTDGSFGKDTKSTQDGIRGQVGVGMSTADCNVEGTRAVDSICGGYLLNRGKCVEKSIAHT